MKNKFYLQGELKLQKETIELKEKAKHLQIMKKAAPGLKIKASGKN